MSIKNCIRSNVKNRTVQTYLTVFHTEIGFNFNFLLRRVKFTFTFFVCTDRAKFYFVRQFYQLFSFKPYILWYVLYFVRYLLDGLVACKRNDPKLDECLLKILKQIKPELVNGIVFCLHWLSFNWEFRIDQI